ncbi:MAG: DUF1572 family protein [Bacteroidia bacterium]|nr:DUF1572 family protein [Bacteroidia bacterium]
MDSIQHIYIANINRIFAQYKKIGEGAIEQINNEEINFCPDKESNSIALIVKHLSGNMLSRWTDFFLSDGEKEWRKRDTEFEGTFRDKKQLIEVWTKGWNCLFNVTEKLKPEDLLKTVSIRGEELTVLDAINRQIAHYSYHVGQMVYLSKHIRSSNWKSLSIPKGQSNQYNNQKTKQK